MALTRGSAAGVLIGLAALVSTAVNPNFELRNLTNPAEVIRKWDYNQGYEGSGKVYCGSYGLAGVAAAGLFYNALSGNLKKRE